MIQSVGIWRLIHLVPKRILRFGLPSIAIALAMVVVFQNSANASAMPKSLRSAIEKTMAASTVQVVTSLRVLNSTSETSSKTSTLDFQYPDRVESEPRNIEVDGHHYGSSIYVGKETYTVWSFPGSTDQFKVSTTNSTGSESLEEQELSFYPLLCALASKAFVEHGDEYGFSSANGIRGEITLSGDVVTDSYVIYRTKPFRGYRSYTERQEARYSKYGEAAAIVLPPKAVIKK